MKVVCDVVHRARRFNAATPFGLLLVAASCAAAPLRAQVTTGGLLPNPAPGDPAAAGARAPERPALYLAHAWARHTRSVTLRTDIWTRHRIGIGIAAAHHRPETDGDGAFGADIIALVEVLSPGVSITRPGLHAQAALTTAFHDGEFAWSAPLSAGISLHLPLPAFGAHILATPWASGYAVIHGAGGHHADAAGAGTGLRVIFSDAGILTFFGFSGYARLFAGSNDGMPRFEVSVLRLLK